MEKPFPAYRGEQPYIFVSYAHADAESVFPEMQTLRDQGFNVWYDEGIEPGSTWREEVALALTQSSLLLYFVTPNSVSSENCHQELNFALSRERKVLAVHLQDAELTMGIELSLSNKQAIIKSEHSEAAFKEKFLASVKNLMPALEVIPLPGIEAAAPESDRKSIAILPFINRSSDPENDYLCDGISEELISGLSTVEGLLVASQLSSFGLRGQTLSSKAIGEKLNVEKVLTGSVQKSANRVRITVTLTDADSDTVVWSERYNGTLDDIFELQEQVANKVVEALQSRLVESSSEPIIAVGTNSTDAYDCFLRGTHHYWRQTRHSLQEADDLFSQAVAIDPGFGRAWWYQFLGRWLMNRMFDMPLDEFVPRGREAIDGLGKTDFHAPMPSIWIGWQLDPESEPDDKSLALHLINVIKQRDPTWRGSEYAFLGESLAQAGLLDGCVKFLDWYEEHHPKGSDDLNNLQFQGNILFALGRYEKCIDHFSNALVMQPQQALILGTRAMAYSRTGQFGKAKADLDELVKVFPRNFAQFYDLFWRREMDAAREVYQWMESRRNLTPLFKVWARFLMGDIDEGLDGLEEMGANSSLLRFGCLLPMTPSIVEEVTRHPRYQEMLAATGLDNAWRDELIVKVNELEPITGIRIGLDQVY
jgi:TolB-like protein